MLLYQVLAFALHGKIYKKSCKNNKFQVSATTWNEEFELRGGSYSVSDIHSNFEMKYKIELHLK